jgi:hypothetical protein
VRRVFYACRFALALHVVAAHNNMRYARLHGMRSVRLPRFGDTFQWRKTFGLLFRCANLQLQCAATSISLALTSISLALTSISLALTSISLAQTSFVLTPQQMAALNFLHFYFVK